MQKQYVSEKKGKETCRKKERKSSIQVKRKEKHHARAKEGKSCTNREGLWE
jgi:hypothetical protein